MSVPNRAVNLQTHVNCSETLPSASGANSITSPIRTLMTPRKPWSFFLNFFWSNTWTARMLSSFTLLRFISQLALGLSILSQGRTYKSKCSFQYGFRVRLETWVVFVCSPLMVATANGSGNPVMMMRLAYAAWKWLRRCMTPGHGEKHTEDISLV